MATPYTYRIGWKQHNLWYYGVRYARGCVPEDLWKTYFTSSIEVSARRLQLGEPDVVEVRRVFDNGEAARRWEERVLRKVKAVKSPLWLNLSNGGVEFCSTRPETRAKIAAYRTGKPSPRRGVKLSDDTRAKMSSAKRGRKVSQETKEALRLAATGSKNAGYGKIWITDGKTNSRIGKDDIIPDGWRRGRSLRSYQINKGK